MRDEQKILSEITNPKFVSFIRDKVALWLDRCDEAYLRLEQLCDLNDRIKTKIQRLSAQTSPLKDDEDPDEWDPEEERLCLEVDQLAREAEDTLEEIGLIIYDPNLVPTCGLDSAGQLVMLDQLWFESQCVILALWLRKVQRTELLFFERESSTTIESLAQILFYQCGIPEEQGFFGKCFHAQFQSIDLILSEVLRVFSSQGKSTYGAVAKKIELKLSENGALFRGQLRILESRSPISRPVLGSIFGEAPNNEKKKLDASSDREAAGADLTDKVASSLRNNSFKIFQRLRTKQRFVAFETLRNDVWNGKNITDAAIKRAISRLNDDLSETPFSVEINAERAKLDCSILDR